ncbi:MAG: hypothetical protein WBB25_20035, partial [Sulfitobacter sp.]
MANSLNPIPNTKIRKDLAHQVREAANTLAHGRIPIVTQKNNGEVDQAIKGDGAQIVAAHSVFSKGLTHDNLGRVTRGDLQKFVSEINQDG